MFPFFLYFDAITRFEHLFQIFHRSPYGPLLPRETEEFDLSDPPSFTTPGPTNQSPIYIYEYFRERAGSFARPPGSRSLLWHPAHTSGIVAWSRLRLLLPRPRASMTKMGEITGVYFCESSWILLSWPYFAAPARLRVRHGNHGWREEWESLRDKEKKTKKNEDLQNSNGRVRSLR